MPVEVGEADVVVLLLSRSPVVEPEAALAVGVDDVRIAGLGHHRAGLAAAVRLPSRLGAAGLGAFRQAGHRNGGIVLLAGVEAVGEVVRDVHLVELGCGLVQLGGPRVAAVDRDVGAAVVRLDHDERVVRVDPEVVVVAVGCGAPRPVAAAVRAHPVALGHPPEDVRVGGMGLQIRVVEGPVADRLEVGDLVPGGAAVVGAVDAARVGGSLDQHVDAVGVGRADRQIGLAAQARGKPVGGLVPGVAAVAGDVDAVLEAARNDRPRLPLGAPHARIDGVRVVGGELEVGRAGAVRDEEDVLPARAPVAAAVDAPLGVRREGVADGGHVDEVGVVGVDEDRAAVAGALQPDVPPGLARVGGLVDPVADDDVAAQAVGAGRNVDDVRVRIGHPDRADRPRPEVAVRDVAPVVPAVGGLPDAAAGGAHVEGGRVGAVARHGGDAAAARGAHVAVAQAAEQVGGEARGRRSGRWRGWGRGEVVRMPAMAMAIVARDLVMGWGLRDMALEAVRFGVAIGWAAPGGSSPGGLNVGGWGVVGTVPGGVRAAVAPGVLPPPPPGPGGSIRAPAAFPGRWRPVAAPGSRRPTPRASRTARSAQCAP